MSKTLSTSLYEAFQRHGMLKLRADLFLDVLRSVGAPMSPSEENALIEWLGKDSIGCVDVAKFCARFEGNEQEARSAPRAPVSLAQCVSESMIEEPLTSHREIGEQSSSADRALSHGLRVKAVSRDFSTEETHDAAHLDDDNVEPLEASLDGVFDHCDRPALSFSRQVTADDNSVWSLGSGEHDKYTLSRRHFSKERERIVEKHLASVNQERSCLEASGAKA
eukprot:TRINITY_DN11435_c0_g2_i1.p1 TRINITY_DN11435_c0_g2~~TRINITY_DN11435_c0_g2_i1.p1  ORF type:complete len:222 (-),score=21.72 TRINITY_DN11435_c0_g2_i1:214-879(-)